VRPTFQRVECASRGPPGHVVGAPLPVLHVDVPVPTVHEDVGCQQRVLAQCLVAVWTGAAERRATAVIGSFGSVTGFAGLPVNAVWHCQ